MIVKFLPNKKGGGIGSVNYLLNERTQQGTARILKGNEAQTRAIINQIPYKQKTTFGVLSFAEQADSISDEIKQEIIKDFERHLLGDFMKDRVNILWVEHSDKGRLELNFLIPKIDLVSGKSFNPYYDERDRVNVNLWKKTINDEYNFISPDDPKNQYNQNRHKATLEQYNTITELDNALKDLVAQNVIKNRTHIIELLNASGYEVTRQPKSGISIKLPNQKKPFRLKGGIYSAEFTDIERLSELGESQSRRIQQYANRDTQAECIANRARLEEFIKRRDERNKERYNKNTIANNITNTKHQKRYYKRNFAELTNKNFQWTSIDNSNDILHTRIFNELLAKRQRNAILSNGEHSIEKMANSDELSFRANKQQNGRERKIFSDTTTNNNTNTQRNTIPQNKPLGLIKNHTIRNRIIERSREITKRNFEIAERDREKTEREQIHNRRIRELAKRENDIVLRRLIGEIHRRSSEYYFATQNKIKQQREQIRKLRERAERDNADKNRIKQSFANVFNNGLQQIAKRLREIEEQLQFFAKRVIGYKNTIRNELGEYANRVSKCIQRTKSTAIERNGTEFRECLERELKRASANCGSEIRRELQKPERQRLVKLTREKKIEKQKHKYRGLSR